VCVCVWFSEQYKLHSIYVVNDFLNLTLNFMLQNNL